MAKQMKMAAENRAALLLAAKQVFAQQTFEAASVRDIVRAADLSPGTFYNHFQNKDQLMFTIVEQFTRQLNRQVRSNLIRFQTDHGPQSVEDLIRVIFHSYFETIAGDELWLQVVMRNPGVYRSMRHHRVIQKLLRHLRINLSRASTLSGLVQMPAEFLNHFILTAGYEMLAYASEHPQADVGRLSEVVIHFMLGGFEKIQGYDFQAMLGSAATE